MPVDENGNPTAPVAVVSGEGDARTRDLIGRMDARLTAIEALNKEQAEELAWFKMMEGEQEPARQPAPAAPPQAAPAPTPYPLPQLPTAPPAPVYAPQAAANPPQLYYQDPTTRQLLPYSPAPAPVAPGYPPMRPPVQPPVAPAPTPPASPRAASPEAVRWQAAFDKLAEDIQFFGNTHPRVADQKAAELIREAVKAGDLNAVLRAHAKEEPMLRAVIQERIAEDAKAAGLVMPAEVVEPAPGTPEARKPGEPYVSTAVQVAVASKDAATPMKAAPATSTAPVAKVAPAEATTPVAKVPTVTPTSPPPAADEAQSLVTAAKDTTQHIDEAFG